MVLKAVDMGINYFDTAPDYGRSEDTIGRAMRRLQRDKVIIASKFCDPFSYPSHLDASASKKDYIRTVEGSLKRLKTDYLDLCFVHAMGEMSANFKEEKDRLLSPDMLEAAQQLKKEGKIRFLAVSSHGPDNMERLMFEAVNSGHYDVIMPAFNFMKFPKVPEVIKAAKAKGMGVIAMKTLAGARDLPLETGGADFAHAAFKWVLKHAEVDGLVVTMKTDSMMSHYVKASGQAYTQADQQALEAYAAAHGQTYCRTGCNECGPSCPQGVPIAKVLRHQMYFADYGDEKKALKEYGALPTNAAACADCAQPGCAGACPYGLDIPGLLQEAHEDLSLEA